MTVILTISKIDTGAGLAVQNPARTIIAGYTMTVNGKSYTLSGSATEK